MFKTRIVRWKLEKRLKEQEVIHMMKLNQQRHAAGKNSSFRVRGHTVSWERIEQYLKRRPDLQHKMHTLCRNTLELEITCRTPSPILDIVVESPYIPSVLEPTLDVEIQEDTMRVFERYHTGAFESGVWVLDDINLCEHGFVHIVQTLNDIGKVPRLFQLNQTEAGFRALRQGLESLRDVLQTREPRFYYSMMVNILNLEGDIQESAVRFAYRIHKDFLGDQHPLSLVWYKLKMLPQELRLETLRSIYAFIYSHIENDIKYKSQHVLDVLRIRCSLLKLLKDVDGNEFRQIISSHKVAAAESFEQGKFGLSCRISLGLAIAQLDADEVKEAEETLVQIGSMVKNKYSGSSKGQWLDKQQEGHCSMSSLCFCKRRYDQSTSYTKIVYDYYKGNWEPWSRWSPAAVGMIIRAHRQAGAGDAGAAKLWFDILRAMSSDVQAVRTEGL